MDPNNASTHAPLLRRKGSLLIVDDSETLRRRIREDTSHIGALDEVFEASDGLQAFRVLRERPIDIVLCDLEMPGTGGFEFLRMCGSVPSLRDIPVIVLTSSDAVQIRIRALRNGASDYVCKPVHPEELCARLQVHLSFKLMCDQLREQSAEFARMAQTDALTQLPNRRQLDQVAERELARCARYGRPMSVVMLDLDHFKQLNDTFGHAAGDLALARVASALSSQVRTPDLVARYGGEEFAILMPETRPTDAAVASERIRGAIAALEVVHHGVHIPITASLGVAGMPSCRARGAADLFEAADRALYAAKKAGRNRVSVSADLEEDEAPESFVGVSGEA